MCNYCEKLALMNIDSGNPKSSYSIHIDYKSSYSWMPYTVLTISHLLDLGYCGDKHFELDIPIIYCPFCGRKLNEDERSS